VLKNLQKKKWGVEGVETIEQQLTLVATYTYCRFSEEQKAKE
jgi:hypothetical protein